MTNLDNRKRPPIYLIGTITLLLLALSTVSVWAKPPQTGLRWTIPTFTPTATPHTGSICVHVFHDRNQDGKRQPAWEELLGGAQIELAQLGAALVLTDTTLADDTSCFRDLMPASYLVRAHDADGYASTTDHMWGAFLQANMTLTVPFGDIYVGDGHIVRLPLLLNDYEGSR